MKHLDAVRALLAACLFGVSAPLIKLLLDETSPIQMASFLYLGSGTGLFLLGSLRRFPGETVRREAGLRGRDAPWLAGAVLSGGIIAPVMLISGLKQTPAATASLLLNFEAVATAAIAAVLFREAVGLRVWTGIACITGAAVLLSIDAEGVYGMSLGAMGILSACLLWGLDNNLTRHISGKDPVAIAAIKGMTAGAFLFVLDCAVGYPGPGLLTISLSLLLGFCCYGSSIVLFIQAMRGLGAARTGAYFALAPFIGAALSFFIFRELPGALFISSLPLLVVGVVLMLNEKHSHRHIHLQMEHAHYHSHDDDHHGHPHSAGEEDEAHSHHHVHDYAVHAHAHTPDIHHRHGHAGEEATEKENAG